MIAQHQVEDFGATKTSQSRYALSLNLNEDAALVDRLFRTYDMLSPDLLEASGPVLFVTSFDPSATRLRSWVEELDVVGGILEELRVDAIWKAAASYQAACIVLNERYLGITGTHHAIRHLRKRARDLPLVVLSRDAVSDRLEVGQAWSADVILSTPVNRTSIKLGVVAAIGNRRRQPRLLHRRIFPHLPRLRKSIPKIWDTANAAVRALIGDPRSS